MPPVAEVFECVSDGGKLIDVHHRPDMKVNIASCDANFSLLRHSVRNIIIISEKAKVMEVKKKMQQP